MATSKSQQSQVNLKERIAALQQRNASPSPPSVSPAPPITPTLNSAGLRDKIAKFEKKGGVPVPRGSFGLGAPPPAENGPSKRRGELYGNRIPSASRTASGIYGSRSNSPFGFDSPRLVSTPLSESELEALSADLAGIDPYSPSSPSSSPVSPLQTISPQSTGNSLSLPLTRGTRFSVALSRARQGEGSLESSLKPASASSSPPSSESQPALAIDPAQQRGDEDMGSPQVQSPSPINAGPFESPVEVTSVAAASPLQTPSIMLSPSMSPSGEAEKEQVASAKEPNQECSNTGSTTPANQSPTIEKAKSPKEDVAPARTVLLQTPSITVSPSEKEKEAVSPANDPIQRHGNGVTGSPPIQSPLLLATSSKEEVVSAGISPLQASPVILFPSQEVERERASSDSVKTTQEPAQPSPSTVAPTTSTEVLSMNPGMKTPGIRVESPPSPSGNGRKHDASASQLKDTKEVSGAVLSTPASAAEPPNQPVEPVAKDQGTTAQKETNVSSGPSPAPSSASPVGPFLLANAVHDLGQVVANIHDMFPDQLSPLNSPPSYRPFHISAAPPGTQKKASSTDEPMTPAKSNQAKADNQVASEEAPAEKSTHLTTTPRTARPTSMIEPTSPGQITVAQRVTPVTSRGVPVFLSANDPNQQQHLLPGQPNFTHFPPTPEPDKSEFGSVTLRRGSYMFSQSSPYVNPAVSTTRPSFSAVVHGKTAETPVASSSSYQAFYSNTPATPKDKKTGGEPVTSPGFGELATLLHEAALLEFSLEQGQLPAEKKPSEDEEKQESGKVEKEKLEKEAAARAKVEEEKRKHEAVAKARAKQEAKESKPRSSFRNPLLRSKTSHQRDASTDSTASNANNPSRSKSVLLPFRPPQPTTPSSSQAGQSSPSLIASIPETEVAGALDSQQQDSADPSLLQTSPKSPRQLFAGLKRLTSSSRSSTGTISRNSVSASSEMSSEDSMSLPTPPGINSPDTVGSANNDSGQGGIFGSAVLTWPSLSPKKSPNMGRAASFTDKMLGRGRTKSSTSTNTAYETIDRITRPAAAQLPPLDPISFSLDVSAPPDEDLSPPPELVSPRRSASLYVPSTSTFPPVYSARPTSSVYTPLPPDTGAPSKDGAQQFGLNAVLSGRLKSPEFNLKSPDFNQPSTAGPGPQNMNGLFSVKPTSPVYTPIASAMKSQETITERLPPSTQQQGAESLLPSPQDIFGANRRSSWISDMSMDSSSASIPSPFFDAFPAVPDEMPLPPALPGRQRPVTRPSLPLTASSSFFDSAPLSSAAIGAEFSVPSPYVRSAMPRLSGDHHR